MRRSVTLVLAAAATLALGACAGTGGTGAASESTRPPFRTADPAPLGPTGTPAPVTEARWTAIRVDLAGRGVTGEPELVSAEQVVFTDGSLGCPSPGISYTQALIDGMRVIVAVDGTRYDYRFGDTDTVLLCTR